MFPRRLSEEFEARWVKLFGPTLERSLQLDDYSCGAHCTRMVLRHLLGSAPSIPALKDELRTTKDGTTSTAIQRVLRARGMRVGLRPRLKIAELVAALEEGKLAIVYLDDEHYGVAYRATDSSIYLADPSILRQVGREVPRAKFLRRWTSHWALLVSPHRAASRSRGSQRAGK